MEEIRLIELDDWMVIYVADIYYDRKRSNPKKWDILI